LAEAVIPKAIWDANIQKKVKAALDQPVTAAGTFVIIHCDGNLFSYARMLLPTNDRRVYIATASLLDAAVYTPSQSIAVPLINLYSGNITVRADLDQSSTPDLVVPSQFYCLYGSPSSIEEIYIYNKPL
jgi:hypothetical protein